MSGIPVSPWVPTSASPNFPRFRCLSTPSPPLATRPWSEFATSSLASSLRFGESLAAVTDQAPLQTWRTISAGNFDMEAYHIQRQQRSKHYRRSCCEYRNGFWRAAVWRLQNDSWQPFAQLWIISERIGTERNHLRLQIHSLASFVPNPSVYLVCSRLSSAKSLSTLYVPFLPCKKEVDSSSLARRW